MHLKALTPQQQSKRIQLINRHFTVFALGLVTLGIAMSQPAPHLAYFCLGLLVFTGLFNEGTAEMARRTPERGHYLSNLRLAVNLAANCLLVYFLAGHWTPIWLLFVLTPVATAVYSTRSRTWSVTFAVSALLIAVHAARGLDKSPVEWAHVLTQAGFIVFLGLFINRLTEFIHAESA